MNLLELWKHCDQCDKSVDRVVLDAREETLQLHVRVFCHGHMRSALFSYQQLARAAFAIGEAPINGRLSLPMHTPWQPAPALPSAES